jgi:single-stranded DNA-binding protein
MSLNNVILNGRLPHFEGNYKPGEGEKTSFLAWSVSAKRNFKKADEQYYPDDLIPFKAFGPKADFINNNFGQGDGIIIIGTLRKDDDYEKDGQTVRGGIYVLVEQVMFADGKANAEGGSKAPGNKPAAAPKGPGVPKAPVGKPGVPKSKRPF